MSIALYRKYRPQNFDELVAQDHITKVLKNAIKKNQLSHAYLFVGSRGTGKTSTARILAKAVNCENPTKDGNPCNECRICKSISDGTFLDLVEIDAASNRGIDQIRELKERIEFSPSDGKYKVYIIDEVHMLTNEAFNALLKTLEEPPEHVIFILATTDVHKLPATILSRCQRYDFRLGSDSELREMIEKVAEKEGLKIENGALDIIVRNAKGSYRDALSLLDVVFNGQPKDSDVGSITEEETRIVLGIPEFNLVNNFLISLVSGNAKEALECIKEIEMQGINIPQFVSYTLEILREVLVSKLSKEESEYTFANDIDQKVVISLINAFINVERDLKNTSNQILLLQMLIPLFINDQSEQKVSTKVSDNVKKGESNIIVEKKSEKIEVVNSDSGVLNVEDIKKKWKEIVEKIKGENSTLSAFLSVSRAIGVNGDELNLEVPFKFYKDQIEDHFSAQIISQSINDVLNINCRVRCTVNDSYRPKIQSSADVVLKNIPVIDKKVKEPEAVKKEFKKKNLGADVESIFAGM